MKEDETMDVNIEVKVDEEIATGIFTNFSNISHTPDEFVFDYLFVHPAPPPGFGKLVSRLILTPAHAKKLLFILSENIKEYEGQFGEIHIEDQFEEQGNLQ